MTKTDPEWGKPDQQIERIDHIDWIDQALDHYTSAFEEDASRRIMATTVGRVKEWRNRRRRVLRFELYGAFGLACALIIFLFLRSPANMQVPQGSHPIANHTTVSLAGPAEDPASAVVHSASVIEPRIAHRKRSAVLAVALPITLPRLNQFPTPYPPSAQEKELLLIASQPALTGELVKQLDQGLPVPVQIPLVTIPALQFEALNLTQ